jgi:hypothetical protein
MKTIFPALARRCLPLLAAALPMSLAAQPPTVNLRFVSFPKSTDADPVELLLAEGQTIQIELPTNSISKAYKVPALSTWALGKSSTNAEGKSIFLPYGQTRSAGAGEQLILVVRKGRDDAAGLELTALKDGGDGFDGGKYLLLNASKVDVAGNIGTGKFTLEPGKHSVLAPNPTKTEAGRKYCFAKFYFRQDEEIQPFFSSTWRFNEEARSMVVFYHDPKTRQLAVHTIRSFAR